MELNNKLNEIIGRNLIQFLESNDNISFLCRKIAIEFAKHILEEVAENAEISIGGNKKNVWNNKLCK
jgi:hypothetical protein